MPSTSANPGSALLLPFYPALDGLRAIAFLLVFLVHYAPQTALFAPFRWGWVGVDLFFVLSGFLITGILFDTLHRPDFFRNFYIRRTLRIFPLYYTVWLLFLLVTPILHVHWTRYTLTMTAYVGNLFIPAGFVGRHVNLIYLPFAFGPDHVHRGFFNIGHLWSLCVEEQFYLAWPAVVWLVRSRRALLRLCLAVIVAAPLLRWLYLETGSQVVASSALYCTTLPRVDTLLFGAAIALWIRWSVPALPSVRRLAWMAVVGPPILLAVLWSREHTHPAEGPADPMVSTIGYTLIALTCSGVLLLTIDRACPWRSLLESRLLRFLGHISYGMYVIHYIPCNLILDHSAVLARHHVWLLVPILTYAGTAALAWLSFRFIESPFLRLKSTLAPRPGAIEDPPPTPLPADLPKTTRIAV